MDSDQQRRSQHGVYQTSTSNMAGFYSNHNVTGNTATNTASYPVYAAPYGNAGGQTPVNFPPYFYNGNSTRTHGPRLGLIRGYHRQMYEPIPPHGSCCDCTPVERTKGASPFDGCNWGVACGCVLLIIGVIAILMGFMVPQNVSERASHLTREERYELKRINLFIDIFVISGLSVLSIGGLLISIALLLPLLRRRAQQQTFEEPLKYFGSEVYVKAENAPINKTGKPSIDLGFHKDVIPGDVALRKVQPQGEKTGPIDVNVQ